MPKIKTHSGAKKRFIITGKGNLKRRKASGNHLLEKKTQKRKRTYAIKQDLVKGDKKNVRRLLNI